MDNSRLVYVDIMKGIAITLIVIAHTSDPVAPNGIIKFASTFIMQLFFMASGIVVKRTNILTTENIKVNIRKKFLSIMIPYFIWCMILMPPTVENLGKVFYGSFEGLIQINPFIVHLWFLPCFFIATIMSNVIMNLSMRIRYKYFIHLCVIVTFMIGFSLPKLPIGYPWGLNLSFIAMGFILSGFYNQKFISGLDNKLKLRQQIPFVLIPVLILTVGTLYGLKDITFVSMCSTEYGPVFWFLVNGYSGIILVRALSSMLARVKQGSLCFRLKKIALWLGHNSMGIFIVQLPICICVVIPLMLRLGLSQNNSLHTMIAGLAALAISSLMTLIIKTFCPQIFGRNS